MRFYLLVSLFLSLVLPLLAIPAGWQSKLISNGSVTGAVLLQAKHMVTRAAYQYPNPARMNSEAVILPLILWIIFAVYIAGAVYTVHRFILNLKNIYGFIQKNDSVKEGKYILVGIQNEVPAFSFFNYIFINYGYKNISGSELQTIKDHEIIHAKQYHSLDILCVGLVRSVFWFNPLVNYLHKMLQDIHEYIVDEKMAGNGDTKKAYANLLLSLTSENTGFNPASGFTGKPIKRRILMLAKPRTPSKHKLLVFTLVPLTVMLLFLFSCSKNFDVKAGEAHKYPVSSKVELKEYSGLYLPAPEDTQLKPMEILHSNNRLFRFIEVEPDLVNRTIELQYVTDNSFAYTDNSNRSIEFVLDDRNIVTGCILTRPDGTFRLTKQN